MSREILFTFRHASKGGTKVEGVNFQDKGCEQTIRGFLNNLPGGTNIDGEPQYEPEFFQEESEHEREAE